MKNLNPEKQMKSSQMNSLRAFSLFGLKGKSPR